MRRLEERNRGFTFLLEFSSKGYHIRGGLAVNYLTRIAFSLSLLPLLRVRLFTAKVFARAPWFAIFRRSIGFHVGAAHT